jgi:hypothetical protein
MSGFCDHPSRATGQPGSARIARTLTAFAATEKESEDGGRVAPFDGRGADRALVDVRAGAFPHSNGN